MKKIRCLIADDEKQAREGLFLMLRQYEQLEVVAICENGLDAVRQIEALRPHLVFLDIQMPRVNGFEVVNSLAKPLPAFIFITGHDEYALRAFEVHALDYLLKPFSNSRLDEAIDHAIERLSLQTAAVPQLPVLGRHPRLPLSPSLVDTSEFPGKLVFKADARINFQDFGNIIWVEAYDYYIKIHLHNKYHLVRDTMKHMEEKLPSDDFVRVHKSAIVNTRYIQAIEPLSNNDHMVYLTNGVKVKASRSYAQALRRWLI